MQELILRRSAKSKTWQLEGRQKRWRGSLGHIHWKNDPSDDMETWKEIDVTPDINGLVSKAPYESTAAIDGFWVKSRYGGEFDVRLKEARKGLVKHTAKNITPKVEVEEIPFGPVSLKLKSRLIYEDVYKDTDVIVEFQAGRVCLKRRIKSANAPDEFDIEITEKAKGVCRILPLKPAIDANQKQIRMDSLGISKGRTEKLVLEKLDKEDLEPIAYPIMDATEAETIDAGNEDAHENPQGVGFSDTDNDVRMTAYTSIMLRSDGGFVWDNVDIAQGSTIDNAYVDLYVDGVAVDDPNVDIHANDVDNANDFDAEADVVSRTRTAASVQWTDTGLGQGFQTSPDLQAIVEDIITDRAGWSSGNTLCLLFDGRSDANYNFYASSYDDNSSYGAQLDITYTAGGNDWNESATLIIGLNQSSTRTVAWDRSSSTPLGMALSATRVVAWNRVSTSALGLALTATYTYGWSIAASLALGLALTATRTVAWSRSSSTPLGLALTATRQVAWNKTSSLATGLALTATRAFGRLKSATLSLGLALTATRQVAWNRSSTTPLGLALSATRTMAWNKSSALSLGLALTATRTVAWARSSTIQLGLSLSIVITVFKSVYGQLKALGYRTGILKATSYRKSTLEAISKRGYGKKSALEATSHRKTSLEACGERTGTLEAK